MTRTRPVNGICPEESPLTRCIYYNVAKTDTGTLWISRLPILEQPLCGNCGSIPEIAAWRENNPDADFTSLINVPALRNILYSRLQTRPSLIIADSLKIWIPIIELGSQTSQINGIVREEPAANFWIDTISNTSWKDLHRNNSVVYTQEWYNEHNLYHAGSMGQSDQICSSLEPILNTCPEHAKMPWWQGPFLKKSKDLPDDLIKAQGNCIAGSLDPNFGCCKLYESYYDAHTYNKALDPEVHKYSYNFIKLFNKWLDDNQSFFDSGTSLANQWVDKLFNGNVVVPFFGEIDVDNNPEHSPVVNLMLYKIDPSIRQLVPMEGGISKDQLNIPRDWLVLFDYSYSPPLKCLDNYLLTYNLNSCAFVEQIVESYPEIVTPEISVVKYIPCASEALSITNPEEFNRIIIDFAKRRTECAGSCCYLAVDIYGRYSKGCYDVSSVECSVENIQNLINSDTNYPYWFLNPDDPRILLKNKTVLSAIWNGHGTNCETTNCNIFDVQIYPSLGLGTCCYIKEDGTWGCLVNNKESCEFLEGFWQPPQPNGIGGYNEPSCATGGASVVALDDITAQVTILEGRQCDLYPTKPPVNPDDSNPIGSCCTTIDYFDVNDRLDITTFNDFIKTQETNIPSYINNQGIYRPSSSVSLNMLNNGSIIKLTFSDVNVMNDMYGSEAIKSNPSSILSLRLIKSIENSFKITGSQTWNVKFKKIENNSIVLTVTKI